MHDGENRWEPNWLALAGAFAITSLIVCIPCAIIILCVKAT